MITKELSELVREVKDLRNELMELVEFIKNQQISRSSHSVMSENVCRMQLGRM